MKDDLKNTKIEPTDKANQYPNFHELYEKNMIEQLQSESMISRIARSEAKRKDDFIRSHLTKLEIFIIEKVKIRFVQRLVMKRYSAIDDFEECKTRFYRNNKLIGTMEIPTVKVEFKKYEPKEKPKVDIIKEIMVKRSEVIRSGKIPNTLLVGHDEYYQLKESAAYFCYPGDPMERKCMNMNVHRVDQDSCLKVGYMV